MTATAQIENLRTGALPHSSGTPNASPSVVWRLPKDAVTGARHGVHPARHSKIKAAPADQRASPLAASSTTTRPETSCAGKEKGHLRVRALRIGWPTTSEGSSPLRRRSSVHRTLSWDHHAQKQKNGRNLRGELLIFRHFRPRTAGY